MTPPGKNVIFIVDEDPNDRQLNRDGVLENNSAIDHIFSEDGIQLMEIGHPTEPGNLTARSCTTWIFPV